ncbi:DUF1176 domain-containing protein [Burkholderia pseudomallei]
MTSAGYDSSQGELTSFKRAQNVGSCGASTTWIFDGAKFVPPEKRFQGACSCLFMDDWPWLYRTKTRGVWEPGLSGPSQARSAMWRSSWSRPCALAVGDTTFCAGYGTGGCCRGVQSCEPIMATGCAAFGEHTIARTCRVSRRVVGGMGHECVQSPRVVFGSSRHRIERRPTRGGRRTAPEGGVVGR